MTTPPGWYPDPQHTGGGPAPERWWDGSGWTEHTRVAQQPAASGPDAGAHAAPTMVGPSPWGAPAGRPPSAPPIPPSSGPVGAPPGGFPPPGSGGRSRGLLVGGIVGALVLVAGLVVGGVLLFREDADDSGDDRADDRPSASASSSPSGGPDEPEDAVPDTRPSTPPDHVPDPLNGIVLPLPDGWQYEEAAAGSAISTGRYGCPADESLDCLRAGIIAQPLPGSGDPEELAREDVAESVELNYPPEAYGGVTEAEEVLSEQVTVAGQQGHRVRRKVVNKRKPDAYVESVVFPSPRDSNRLVLLRISFDIHEEAPTTVEIDRILTQIRPLQDKRDPNEV